MAKIPQHFIDELVARCDIVQLIDQRVPLKKKGSEYSACCPFHNEKTPSFTVSPSKQFYHCFGCGAHGTAVGFLMEYDHLNFIEAIENLADQAGMEVPRDENNFARAEKSYEPLYKALDAASLYFQQQLKQSDTAVAYLKDRGFSGETAKSFGIGFAPAGWNNLLDSLKSDFTEETLIEVGLVNRNEDKNRLYDKFRERIMFPILDTRGRTIAFGGRIIGDGEPKYLNSPETPVFHKGRTLYGLFEARKHSQRLDSLLVVEGYMDCVALAQHGFTNVVATLGTATTRDHLLLLFRSVKHIIVCFDGDNAGRKAAWKALQQAMPVIRDDLTMEFLFLPDGEDPDSYVNDNGAQAFTEFLGQATPLSTYLINTLKDNHRLGSAEGRSQLALEAKILLNAMSEGLLKKQLVKEIAQIAHVDSDDLATAKMTKAAPKTTTRRSSTKNLEMSATRHAVAILLQFPAMHTHLSESFLSRVSYLPGGDLIGALYDQIVDGTEITSAQLLESHRDTKHFQALNALCSWTPPKDTDIERLLTDALMQLSEQYRKKRFAALTKRQKTHILNGEEKEEYLLLLKERL